MVNWFLLAALSATFIGCTSPKLKDQDEVQFVRLWSRQTTSPSYMGYLQPATVTPVLAKNLVLEGNGIDSLKAFDKRTGNVVWSIPLKRGTEGVTFDSATDTAVFGSNNGQFYSVSSDTGATHWSYALHSESTAPPLVQGNFIFHLSMNGTLHAIEKDSGRVIWVKSRQPKDQLIIRGATQPVFENGRIYVGFSDGYFMAYSATDGTLIWEKKLADNRKFNDVTSRPGLTDKCVLVANNTDSLFCLNKTNGETLWHMTEGGSSQPIIVSGSDVIYSTNNEVMIIEAASGKMKKRFTMPKEKGSVTSAIPFQQFLIFGMTEGPLVVMERETGRWIDTFYPGRGITAAPTVDVEKEEIYVVSNQANLYKLALRKRDRATEFLWAQP